jgi:ABC-type transport system involved in multi-copper enzyme maturation permease subunit
MELFIIGIVGICICVSGVFSGEYQSGADSIILSSRYGKSKLVTAKVLAAFAYSLLTFTLFILVGCGIQLMAFGTDGWNLPVQVLSSIAPYSLSLSGAVLVSIATLYLVMLGMVSFTLLLSAKMKSSVPVLVIIILVMMLPMFLGISETSGIWNRILVLLPYRAVQPVFASDFYGYIGYPLGGLTFDIVTVRMVVYAVMTIICIPIVRKAWKRHQVA